LLLVLTHAYLYIHSAAVSSHSDAKTLTVRFCDTAAAVINTVWPISYRYSGSLIELTVEMGGSQSFNFLECTAADDVVFAVAGDGTLNVNNTCLFALIAEVECRHL
jgi:hypothetical protein